MPAQQFELLDYLGPLAVAIVFAILLLVISFCIINFYCVTKFDDLTIFEKAAAKKNMRMGPHRVSMVKRGGFPSTQPREEVEKAQKGLIV